ncbi:MAG: glucosaminidase domain-containing protein [Bacteroidota bacterium]
MQTKSSKARQLVAQPFIRNNWYKLLIVGILLYGVNQKDLQFQINLKAPPPEQPELQPAPVVHPQKAKREKYTEQLPTKQHESSQKKARKNVFDFFSSPTEKSAIPLREALRDIPEEEQLAYLKRFARVAISERKKHGVPSSIILANALLFSQAGQGTGLSQTNNHFGLNCQNNWTGKSMQQGEQCVRAYDNAWSSFRDFSEFLQAQSELARLPDNDYQAWAESMEQLRILPEPNLKESLIELIEYFNLAELDKK